LNNEVQKFRKLNKITQEDLAKMVNVTRQTIISIEQGKYIASLPLALKIARVFNVKVEDVFSLGEDD
jgi:putative transcriptional regulator